MYIFYALAILLWHSSLLQAYIPPGTEPNNSGDITQPGPCPANLVAGAFDFPHLAIPISQKNPDETYSNTFTPYVTAGDMEMIFNFDIPLSRKGQHCVFEFFLPDQSQLTTSSFQLDGVPGEYFFSLSVLGGGAVEGNTTYHSQPLQANPFGLPKIIYVQPGRAWELGSTICVPGAIAMTMSSSNSSLVWFQDYNPCPIGLYISYQP
jgi:hypothetical protein